MTIVACAIGLVDRDGSWVGFAPSFADAYALVAGTGDGRTVSAPATPDDVIALAIAYFADELPEPPEALAATHGDIGSLVRHLAAAEADGERARRLGEAVDAIDDGLAADVVVHGLSRCLVDEVEPVARLRRRAAELLST